jgi:hypothetical protein
MISLSTYLLARGSRRPLRGKVRAFLFSGLRKEQTAVPSLDVPLEEVHWWTANEAGKSADPRPARPDSSAANLPFPIPLFPSPPYSLACRTQLARVP